jgi:hypothetical protein
VQALLQPPTQDAGASCVMDKHAYTLCCGPNLWHRLLIESKPISAGLSAELGSLDGEEAIGSRPKDLCRGRLHLPALVKASVMS